MHRYWIWLSTRAAMSAWERIRVLAHFETPEECYGADARAYGAIEGLKKAALEALLDKDLSGAEKILRSCEKKQIHILTFSDSAYPSALRNIADPPLVLYYRGDLPDFDEEPMIAVVGTRKASAYGMKTARQLAKELAQHGAVVVSGMAEGIDAMATYGALDAQATAVGVLGAGVDRIYPRCNRDLYQKMERQGCLISEYPPGTPPNPWQFPRRNRIISGLSCGVLVVEAPDQSGALITARQALEQGRDVFAVPGNIGISTCKGSNELLRDGAGVVMCGWDVMREYVYRYPDKIHKEIKKQEKITEKIAVDKSAAPIYSDVDKKADSPDSVEAKILALLKSGQQHMDTLIAETGLPSGEVLAALTMLEVQGLVTTQPGGWVSSG